MKTLEMVKGYLRDHDCYETVVFENPDYADAFIGTSSDGRAIYDFDIMVKCLQNTDSMTEEDAIEFIDHNTLRATPYMGDMAPIVMFPAEAWEFEIVKSSCEE